MKRLLGVSPPTPKPSNGGTGTLQGEMGCCLREVDGVLLPGSMLLSYENIDLALFEQESAWKNLTSIRFVSDIEAVPECCLQRSDSGMLAKITPDDRVGRGSCSEGKLQFLRFLNGYMSSPEPRKAEGNGV